jgi:hypothetical protein
VHIAPTICIVEQDRAEWTVHNARTAQSDGGRPPAKKSVNNKTRHRITASVEQETTMRIHNIYVDDTGETHWRDIEIQWVEERNGSKLSARLPANGIIFRETGGDYDLDWHPAPRRQYIINLDGGVRITASDGEAREIGAGEVILVEDVRGKGHLSKSIGGKMRHSIFVPIE